MSAHPSNILILSSAQLARSTMTAVSASGKVLLAGGYLVLDPAYSGIVVSTSSRFYTVIKPGPGGSPNTIRIKSPQFVDAAWRYGVEIADDGTVNVTQRERES